MKTKCYFCNVWLNSKSNQVKMHDGRIVVSCGTCMGLVADAKNSESLDVFCLSNARKMETKN
ncbi:MAG: hypothetical protein OEL52_01030 [Nitrosopumilus sp.]|nr:hypothetical protein [Nitrosopumilus sp.]